MTGKGIPRSRTLATRVKTARGRKSSSTRWLQRQLNDPYVQRARQEGYRSRAAYKLIELDDRFHFLRPGARVVDLGTAPGSWAQVALARAHAGKSGNLPVIGIDLLPVEPMAGAHFLQGDFLDAAMLAALQSELARGADVVLSDMAPNATGHAATDHLRIVALCEAALEFAIETLAEGGHFVAKVWQGGTEGTLLTKLKQHFQSVRHAKPKASRADSAETYVVALGFKGRR